MDKAQKEKATLIQSTRKTVEKIVVFETSEGAFACVLDESNAPNACQNFLELQKSLILRNKHLRKNKCKEIRIAFERIIDNYFIVLDFPREAQSSISSSRCIAEINRSRYTFVESGILAMAKPSPDHGLRKFFITLDGAEWLTGLHTIFGKVISNYDVLQRLSRRSQHFSNGDATTAIFSINTISDGTWLK